MLKTLEQRVNDHEVDRHDAERDLAVEGMTAASTQGGTQEAFQHAEGGLGLPALTIAFDGPGIGQEAAEERGGAMIGVFWRPATGRWDDTEYAELFVQERMMMLGVIAYVPEQEVEPVASVSFRRHAVELQVIRLGTPINHDPQEQVGANVHHGGKLGESSPSLPGALPEVEGDVTRFQARRINGGHIAGWADQAAPARPLKDGVEESIGAPFFRMRRSA